MSKTMMLLRGLLILTSFAVAAMTVCPAELCAEESESFVVPDDQWNNDVKLWLARSVLGEAGWRRFDEYSAIAWVYATRAEQTKRYDFFGMVKRYSAAVQKGNHHRNPWLFWLGLDGTRPSGWPIDEATKTGPLWKGLHREAWLETLEWADDWREGNRENPCPGANHFGGWIDRHRAHAARWVRIECSSKMRNRFYTSLKLTSRKRAGRTARR